MMLKTYLGPVDDESGPHYRLPEPERAVTDRQHRGGHAAASGVPQQVSPRLRGLPEPVRERDELLAAVGADADHHQQAHLVLLQPDLQMDPVDPQVHVVGAHERPGVERAGLVLPLAGEPGDRGRRQAGIRTKELLQRRPEIGGGQTMQIQQRQPPPRPAAISVTRPAGSPTRTGATQKM